MKSITDGLTPEPVFKYFEEISKIPRGSGNEKAASDYLLNFAKSRNLEVVQDSAMNIVIKKPATSGYENSPTVIIQGHLDIVCDKNKSKEHDFEKDPIELRIEGDMLYANGTTLGADDGIAIAYALALLDSKDIPHPPLKVLMTVEEEVGLNGATALEAKYLEGDMLINIDSEEEGKLLAGCAGGLRTRQLVPALWEIPKEGLVPYNISIRVLKGGHSGGEIDKGRGNSNKLMGRVLDNLSREVVCFLSEVSGGFKMNAIPREADAVVLISPDDEGKLFDIIEKWDKTFKDELKASDPGVTVSIKKLDHKVDRVFSKETMKKVIASLVLIPNGIQTMSMDIQGLVESSTNLGVVTTTDTEVTFESALRSSIRSLKFSILNQARMVADSLGVSLTTDSEYPEWEYNPDSKLREIFKRVYKNMYQSEPEVIAVHGGVECGLFKKKNPKLDMVSFGPNMYDVHTPDEHISISSIKRTWEYLLEVLKEVK